MKILTTDDEISPNSIVLGDCLEVMPKITQKVDAVIADLPYGTTNCKWDSVIPFPALWECYHNVIKPNAPIVLFSAQPFTTILITSNIKDFKYCWYWEKEKGTGFLNSKKQPLRAVEEICVFYKKQPTYNPQMTQLDKPYKHTLPISKSDIHNEMNTTKNGSPKKRTYKEYTHAYPKNILKYSRDNQTESLIATQKPIALVEYLIKTYTNEGDLVLDNVAGSGTTLVACKSLNRNFIGIEKNSKNFEICTARLF